MSEVRGKIVLEYKGRGLPEVTFFGKVHPREIIQAGLAIKRGWRRYTYKQHKVKAAAKAEEVLDKQQKQDEIKAKQIEEQANKENKNESGPTKTVEGKSGTTQTGSIRSRISEGRGDGKAIRSSTD